MKRPLILVGAGGHCKSSIEVIETEGRFQIAGILDIPENIGKDILGYKVTGVDADITKLSIQYKNFLVTVGHVRSSEKRAQLFDLLLSHNVSLPSIVSPHAVVSKHASLGKGCIVMHGAIVNAGAVIGDNCIINTSAVVEHDSVVGKHCHISTGTIVNGDCVVEDRCFIGSNAIIREGIRIGVGCLIGAGMFVKKDVAPDAIVK